MSMHPIDLHRADLNLLAVFEALIEERHVGRAADRLALSQSATSHALRRLRMLFGDPLFTRHPRGIEPTRRGLELEQPVAAALSQIRMLLVPAETFDPRRLCRTFTLATHDYATTTLMPPLIARLKREAPAVDIRCVSMGSDNVLDRLDRGSVDFAIGTFPGVTADRVSRHTLFSDRFVGVARRDHPLFASGMLDLEAFVSVPHGLVAPGGDGHGIVDEALQAVGRSRRIATTTPDFLSLTFVIARSDLICVLPERLARLVATSMPVQLFDVPVELPAIRCDMIGRSALIAQDDMGWFLRTALASVGELE